MPQYGKSATRAVYKTNKEVTMPVTAVDKRKRLRLVTKTTNTPSHSIDDTIALAGREYQVHFPNPEGIVPYKVLRPGDSPSTMVLELRGVDPNNPEHARLVRNMREDAMNQYSTRAAIEKALMDYHEDSTAVGIQRDQIDFHF